MLFLLQYYSDGERLYKCEQCETESKDILAIGRHVTCRHAVNPKVT